MLVALLALAAVATGGIILFNVFTNDSRSAATIGVPAADQPSLRRGGEGAPRRGLDPDPNPVAKAGVGDNIVYEQSPLPDEVVPKGSKVTVTYNPGKQPVPIPTDLVGKKYEEAEAELAGLGLKPVRVDLESLDVAAGTRHLVRAVGRPAGRAGRDGEAQHVAGQGQGEGTERAGSRRGDGHATR